MALETPVCTFGWTPDETFLLPGIDGRSWSFDHVRGARGTLVMFLCNHCPYVKAVIGRIVRDVAQLQGMGMGAIAIMSNDTSAYPEDSFDNMKAFAADNRFTFPYVLDADQAVARHWGAVCTPDFFGFGASSGLQYRGRLDSSRREMVPDAPRELFLAMTQILETGQGPADQVPSMGCSIKWK